MCGIIAGVSASEEPQNICFDGTHERVTELTARMVHRGPDEMGVHLGGNFWMGHTRLSIVSPEHGEQPLSNKDNTSFAVVNGEVYNHLALREELNIDPDVFKTQSDSEIVIHGYDKLGVDIADKLLGMFAFVLVTNGGKDVLVARDKIGIKPLYMGKSKDGSEYLFSSELKSIVDQCEAHDMMKFPAGHYWTRKTGLKAYYTPDWDTDTYYDRMLASKAYTNEEQCKKSLEDAVIKRCMADVEVGLLLSGGLDSSIIGSIMHQPNVRDKLTATHGKIKSFAVGQEGSPDILAARAVSKFLGTDHYEALFTPQDAFAVLEKIVYHMETYEPELIRSCIPNYFLAKKAAEHVKVVLTGEGSDEIWSGYLYYAQCVDPKLLQEENRRILKAVQFVNLQRADRMTMAWSLEARVPFFDVNHIATAMALDPVEKLCGDGANGRCEKYFLRKMYESQLPNEVVWRTKAMQCEGVGMTWVGVLQKYISENLVTDDEFAAAATTFPTNPPHSKEEYYYRKIFEKYYPSCEKFVHVWPGGCRAGGSAWENDRYTRAGLKDTELLKKGHGLAAEISV
jgi:asparagine synthase (glutamine-hydrolysing)